MILCLYDRCSKRPRVRTYNFIIQSALDLVNEDSGLVLINRQFSASELLIH